MFEYKIVDSKIFFPPLMTAYKNVTLILRTNTETSIKIKCNLSHAFESVITKKLRAVQLKDALKYKSEGIVF